MSVDGMISNHGWGETWKGGFCVLYSWSESLFRRNNEETVPIKLQSDPSIQFNQLPTRRYCSMRNPFSPSHIFTYFNIAFVVIIFTLNWNFVNNVSFVHKQGYLRNQSDVFCIISSFPWGNYSKRVGGKIAKMSLNTS